MFNVTLKKIKQNFSFQRTFILLCMVCSALFVYGKGSTWNATYQVNVDATRSTGSGTVYSTAVCSMNSSSPTEFASAGNVQSDKTDVTPTSKVTLSLKKESGEIDGETDNMNDWTNTAIKYSDITLVAEPAGGSTFERWESANGSETTKSIKILDEIVIQTEKDGNDAKDRTEINPYTYYPVFAARTYYAYNQPNAYEVITIDQAGNIIQDDLTVTSTPTFTLADRVPDKIIKGTRTTVNADVFSQTADDNGKEPQASYIWDITAHDAPCHTYYGWKLEAGNYNTVKANDKACAVTTTSENENAPAQHKVYVVYKRKRFSMMEYDADNKVSGPLEMPYKEKDGILEYTVNIPSADLGTKYYRIVLGDNSELSVVTDGAFEASLGEEDGKRILIVQPKAAAREGVVYIKLNGDNVAVLNLSVNVDPIYVWLNPAEDLTGTYTYTQNTTGTQVFSVTTSQIQKEMRTGTDYAFTFTAIPNDATKYKFEKWIIRDAEGNIIEEPLTANLTYKFNGNESITPVFTASDRAVFIVKSEPAVEYTDLQQALNRASSLYATKNKAQVVVATVEGNRKGGRLVKGNYTIPGGVTLLVPGESSYTELIGDIDEDYFTTESSTKVVEYCTLIVDDGTTINVNGGNISLYAYMGADQGAATIAGKPFNYGHMQLGKDCQIIVNSGGLYSFGFITGDTSSRIIVKNGAEVYESFQFKDWRGGSESSSMKGNDGKVFPIGQYYIQSIEVPITFEYGAKEYLSTAISVSLAGKIATNIQFIGTQSDDYGLFLLGENTSVTKMYDPMTDRLKVEFRGNGTKSTVNMGHMRLNLETWIGGVDIDSKDYIMPIQNNMDIVIQNTTINVNYPLALMPGSTLLIHDDAILNVNAGSYVYDRGARKLSDGSGYWGASNQVIVPLYFDATLQPKMLDSRPGGIQYQRTDVNLVDAQIIVNGQLNVNEPLYTVKGAFASEGYVEDDDEGLGGANITSKGSGRINVNKKGGADKVYQWKQGAKLQQLPLSSPNLLLHNNKAIGADFAYTEVTSEGTTYIYYQYDGTWRAPEAGVSGVKLYDSNHNQIEKFLITLPTTSVNGYLLASLETTETKSSYNEDDFTISIDGETITEGIELINNTTLKIPITFAPLNIHESVSTQNVTIKNATDDFSCEVSISVTFEENYQPTFSVATSVDIYARVSNPTPAALPIFAADDNIASLSEDNTVNIVWGNTITGANADLFKFAFGGAGEKLSGATVTFTPDGTGQKTATLTLTATYTDANQPTSKQPFCSRTIELVGHGLMIDNTLEFNEVGTITINTEPFALLNYINSNGTISYELVQVGTDNPTDVLEIVRDNETSNSNFTVTPKGIGQVRVNVVQEANGPYERTEISKVFVVVADPKPLTEISCVDSESNFQTLTADVHNVTFSSDQVLFAASTDASAAMWTAQFSSMPGTLTFTPHGNGQWAIQESRDGVSWSEIVWWTQLPSDEQVIIPLTPTSRKVQIQYICAEGESEGYVENLCINPFSIHAETTRLYVPVEAGVVRATSIVFTHASETIDVQGPEGWTITPNRSSNLGSLMNPYYQTTVTISGGTEVQEKNNGFVLSARQGEEIVPVQLATYEFPKPLRMASEGWVSDGDASNNVNDYDESEHYYHYMLPSGSSYTKWDAEESEVIFLNKGSNDAAKRQVAFAYHGLPSKLRFQSLQADWRIEEGKNVTSGIEWAPADVEKIIIEQEGDVYSITQLIDHTSKYVRITYAGTNPNEVAISNIIIEGYPSAVANPTEVEIPKSSDPSIIPSATFDVHVMNLSSVKLQLDNTAEFKLYHGNIINWETLDNESVLTDEDYDFLSMNEEGTITIKVEWVGTNVVNDAYVQILDASNDMLMATVHLVGKKNTITLADANTGIWTGVPDGITPGRPTEDKYTLVGNNFEPYTYHEVNVTNAFDLETKLPLFDYLFIYGETTTVSASRNITIPEGSNGSNARTPYYIYKRNGEGYEFVQMVENANATFKTSLDKIDHEETITGDEDKTYYAIQPSGTTPLNVYITGFCPYATTGSTKDDEGVWYFRGEAGQILNLYLEDCHIYSRNKSVNGEPTAKNQSPSFSDADVVHGSGAVFVFENKNPQDEGTERFNVSIHTRGHNLLKSNFGCYYTMIGTAQVTQVSSPVQIRLGARNDYKIARTTLNFDDLWPIGIVSGSMMHTHTNGFISLQKLVNNAPSIDLGNPNTIVNFNGGQVQLQNAQIVSPNYKTTLAISHRSGEFGNLGFEFAYGVGTDAVGGTVNFNDGTTTVLPMYVSPAHTSNYLLDKDAAGNYIQNSDGDFLTSCLRCPTNTTVSGGSHCMIRACSHVTSKGGAPKDPNGIALARYIYIDDNTSTPKQGYTYQGVVDELPTDLEVYALGVERVCGGKTYQVQLVDGVKTWVEIVSATFAHPAYLVTLDNFPNGLTYQSQPLQNYYSTYPGGTYGLSSITPDDAGKIYLWIPDGVVVGVSPETDKLITKWKACMTEIEATAMGLGGSIGGPTVIEKDEEVVNLVYCQIDQDMHDVISEPLTEDDEGNVTAYKYSAPVVDPTGKLEGDDRYQMVPPTFVSDSVQHSIISNGDYMVTSKVYYITTAQADTWMNFSMPFDVEKIWVVESYSEQAIIDFFKTAPEGGEKNKTELTMQFQARHNADFASFFGVAMAIGADHMDFEGIFNNYLDWAQNRADRVGVVGSSNLYNGEGTYDLRGKYNLVHYNGSNFNASHFYLYENVGDWATKTVNDKLEFAAEWQIVPKVQDGKAIMEKDKVYALLFPYCLGCDVELDADNNIALDNKGLPIINERDYWDYWSGKFLIFESTQASADNPHIIKGSNYVAESKEGQDKWIYDNIEVAENSAALLGNSTFSMMSLSDNAYKNQLYTYSAERGRETYKKYDSNIGPDLLVPTSTILLTGMTNQPKMITRSGQIIYDQPDDDNNGNQNGTSGHMPTVGGGNDLFVTSIAGGINVAVAAPQNVRVLSSTGAVIYSGYVTTAVDIQLPTTGIYIVSGENEVQKILF